MIMITIDEYMKTHNVPLIAKKEGLSFYISQWELNVCKLFKCSQYSFDDYYAAIGKRNRINDICSKCYVDEELIEKIKQIDTEFILNSSEIEINLLDRLANTEDDKNDKWYAFRLLKSRYNEWMKYLV